MGSLVLVLGGARSGKSGFAQKMVFSEEKKNPEKKIFYVATAGIGDDEMAKRVARHRADRPKSWLTLEAQENVPDALKEIPYGSIVLLDCVTMMVTNLMFSHRSDWDSLSLEEERAAEEFVLGEVDRVICTIRKLGLNAVLVSNEVGQGLVPTYPLGRIFRDMAGWVNQRIAMEADLVYAMTAGIPQLIKGVVS